MPMATVAVIRLVFGSSRMTPPWSFAATHTDSDVTATLLGRSQWRWLKVGPIRLCTELGPQPAANSVATSPILTVAWTRFEPGSIRESVPSLVLGTHSEPAPAAGVPACLPTATWMAPGSGALGLAPTLGAFPSEHATTRRTPARAMTRKELTLVSSVTAAPPWSQLQLERCRTSN